MPLLAGIRQRLSRRTLSRPGQATASDLQSPPSNLNTIEPKPLRAARLRRTGPLPQETLATIKRIGAHMDSHAQRSQELLQLFKRMPQAVDAVPELKRQTAQLLEMMNEQLGQSRSRVQDLTCLLQRIDASCRQQTELVGMIHRELDIHRSQADRLTEAVERCQDAMVGANNANNRSAALLERLVNSIEARDQQLVSMIGNWKRWALVALIGCVLLGTAALTLAALALAA
jgi:chromosome segregation ATPase